jgi:hypothetical protein
MGPISECISRNPSWSGVSGSEQQQAFSRSNLKRGEIQMGDWIKARRGVSVVHSQIAPLIIVVVAIGVVLTLHYATLPR